MKNLFKNIGPGTLVAAAFIGPGTVTACTLAGVNHGFTLMWAMVLSIFATITLQEMAARLGLVSNLGLAATVKNQIKTPVFRTLVSILMLSAIFNGNAAYEAGNISGGVLGLEAFISQASFKFLTDNINYLSLIIGVIAFVLLFIGNYKLIERVLVTLVIIMSLAFVVTAIMTQPDIVAVLKGLFTPIIPEDGLLTVIALVGTTVVPYNLFLHASLVQEKWHKIEQLKAARKDLYVSIALGGLVSICIIIAATAIKTTEIKSAADMAKSFEPLFGTWSTYFLGTGLFAAGITSAITAPLAAAYVARGCFGWESNLKSGKFRAVWMLVLFMGILFSSIGINSVVLIQFAQVANGLLLPIIAIFLLWVVNKKEVLGSYRNSKIQNLLGISIVLLTIVLSGRVLLKVFGVL